MQRQYELQGFEGFSEKEMELAAAKKAVEEAKKEAKLKHDQELAAKQEAEQAKMQLEQLADAVKQSSSGGAAAVAVAVHCYI